MTRHRSYEFYEVRSGPFGGDDQIVATRGSEEFCRKWLRNMEGHIERNGVNVYLVRIQLIEAIKVDK